MKLKIIPILTLFIVSTSVLGQTNVNQDDAEQNLSALLSYNFLGGQNSLSKMTPELFFGWNKYIFGKKGDLISVQIKVGPYAASQIEVKDSSSYLPALMMPGNAGFILNNYIIIDKNKHKFLVSPINPGLKLMSNFSDTTKTLLQHNVRTAVGYQYDDLFSLTVQYTWGWHGLTSSAETNFSQTFNKSSTYVKYLTITIQSKISKNNNENPLYLFAAWRGFLNKNSFGNLPNDKILTLGLRKSIDFTAGVQVK